MAETRQEIEEAAIAWLIRLHVGRVGDWEAFVEWLEADPRHSEIYEELELADDAAGGLPSRAFKIEAPEQAKARSALGRRPFLSWGAAAAAGLAVAGYFAIWSSPSLSAIETPPGERRSLTLADGSRIDLNGGTRLRLDPDAPRFVRIETGEALFKVTQDFERPFRLEAGGAQIRVVGTVFNVVAEGPLFEVAVAVGAVSIEQAGEAVRLDSGMALRREGGRLEIVPQSPDAVGGWREARLAYSDAPLFRVAADISRTLGVPVEATQDVRDQRFSGLIRLDGDEERLFHRIAALLRVEAKRSGEGWMLTAKTRAAL